MPPTPIGIHSIHYRVDRCDLSLGKKGISSKRLFEYLSHVGFRTIRDVYAQGQYDRARSMEDLEGFGIRLNICYWPNQPYLPQILLTVHGPNVDFIEFLLHLLLELEVDHTLSSAEFAFDITPATGFLLPLERQITETLFLPYQHKTKPSGSYSGLTYYTTNVRTASKGHRVYTKTIDESRYLRVELVLNRSVIKRLGITLPDLLLVPPTTFRSFIQFRSVNLDRLASYIIRKMGFPGGKPLISETNRPHVTELVQTAWRSYLSTDMGNVVMPQYERLRSETNIKSHGRFLDRHTDLEEEFWEAIN